MNHVGKMGCKLITYPTNKGPKLLLLIGALVLFACKNVEKREAISSEKAKRSSRTMGSIERILPEINSIIPKHAVIEVLSDQLVWAEGPLWIPDKRWVLCSDVKENKIYKWSESGGFELYLEPSGFTGNTTNSRERGSNGLALDIKGNLTICQHGNRQVVRMNAPIENPNTDFVVLASKYKGKRLNSPNDLVFDSKGNLYFTDPPYGLSEAMMKDPAKELSFQGIYKVDKTGNIILLSDAVSRPNGLAFSPDEKTLYVANTDASNAGWLSFPVNDDGTLGEAKEILNVTELIGEEIGYPDGIKVDKNGNIYTAGPGGLWIFSSEYHLLGKIRPGAWVSNCAFDQTFTTLYITADNYLLRVKLSQN